MEMLMKKLLEVLKKHGFDPRKEQMKNGPCIWYGFLMITPALAKFLLENFYSKVVQRVERPGVTQDYSTMIQEERWMDSPNGLVFTDTGWCVDGRHRLKAIVDSGIGVKMSVYVGYPEKIVLITDTHLQRTHGDRAPYMLNQIGVSVNIDPSKEKAFQILTAGIARHVFLWLNGFVPKSGGRVHPYQIQETLAKFPHIPEIAKTIVQMKSTTSWASPAQLGFIATIGMTIHGQKAKAIEFVKRVVQGPTYGPDDPGYSAIDVYREAKQRQMNRLRTMSPVNKFVMLVKTWNLYSKDLTPASVMTIYPKGKYQPAKKVYDAELGKRVVVRGAKGENFPVLSGVKYDASDLPIV